MFCTRRWILALLLVPAPAAAELTLDACRGSARTQHPQVAAARAQEAAAAARRAIGFSGFLPTISAEASASAVHGGFAGAARAGTNSFTGGLETWTAAITARQTLWDFGRTLNQFQAARAANEAADAEAQVASERLEVEAEAAFRTAIAATELVQAAEEALQRADLQRKRADARVQVGQRPRFDLSRADVEVANARLALVAATNGRALAIAQLASACGLAALPAGTTLAPPPTRAPAELPPVDAARQRALERRAEIRAARARLEASEQAVEAARAHYWPTLSASGSVGFRGPEPGDMESGWQALAQVTVPIVAGGADAARVREAEALRDATAANFENLKRSVVLEVDAALLSAQEAQSRLDAATSLERSADEGLRLAEARYETGAGDAVELADAQAQLAQAQATRVRAALDVAVSLARLDRIVGGRILDGREATR